jgi:Cu2+-exporting ATPase
VRAEASGQETVIADIVRMVERAQARTAPIQRVADTVAGKFAYGVMGLSAATFAFWATVGTKLFPQVLASAAAGGVGAAAGGGAAASLLLSLQLACNVLVVACPCALGLATPTAVLVGTAAGARRGLLIRGGDVLEATSQVSWQGGFPAAAPAAALHLICGYLCRQRGCLCFRVPMASARC